MFSFSWTPINVFKRRVIHFLRTYFYILMRPLFSVWRVLTNINRVIKFILWWFILHLEVAPYLLPSQWFWKTVRKSSKKFSSFFQKFVLKPKLTDQFKFCSDFTYTLILRLVFMTQHLTSHPKLTLIWHNAWHNGLFQYVSVIAPINNLAFPN